MAPTKNESQILNLIVLEREGGEDAVGAERLRECRRPLHRSFNYRGTALIRICPPLYRGTSLSTWALRVYRDTSLIRKRLPLGVPRS